MATVPSRRPLRESDYPDSDGKPMAETPRHRQNLTDLVQAVQKLNLNVTLTVGTISQEVTVSATPGLLDTATAAGGGVVNQARVENLPSMGRQSWDDVIFTSGVRETGTSAFNLTLRNNSQVATVDGAPTTGSVPPDQHGDTP